MNENMVMQIGLGRVEKNKKKNDKQSTKIKPLQTQRKIQQNIHSPLMLILLLKKKFYRRVQEAFVKIYLYKNKFNQHKIVTKYMTTILKFKIKFNQAQSLHKIKLYSQKIYQKSKITYIFKNWMKHKLFSRKVEVFNSLKLLAKSLPLQQNSQSEATTRASKVGGSLKKPDQKNRSSQSGVKYFSVSKPSNVKSPHIQKQSPHPPPQLQKLRQQHDQHKLMQLSQQVRQALKKVQRFDRILYAQQTQKICRDIFNNQLKRLEKIKNSQKQMRSQFYDNQLTITTLCNQIKLIHQMNRQMVELNRIKQIYDKQESKKKEQQLKANIENKRKGRGVNLQTQIKQIIQNIEVSLSKKQYEKARQQINIALTKYQKQQLMKDKLIFYKTLLQTITNVKDLQRCLDDVSKEVNLLKNFDINEPQASIKLMKQSQRQYTQLINKYSKLQKTFQKQTLTIIQTLQLSNNTMIQHLSSLVIKTDKTNEDETKKIQKQLDRYKTQISQLGNIKSQYDQCIKIKKQFQKKITIILQKAQNKTDYRRELDNLHKDKLFIQQKPYTDFFALQKLNTTTYQLSLQKQIQNISSFINQVTLVYSKEKIKSEARTKQLNKLIQNTSKKNINITQIVNVLTSLIYSVAHKTEEEYEQQRTKKIKTGVSITDIQQIDEQIKPKGLNDENESNKKIQKRDEQKVKEIRDLQQQKAQKKINQVYDKITKNQDWMGYMQILKKDRCNNQNKSLQLVLNFYTKISQKLKKMYNLPSKLDKFLIQVWKIFQRINLGNQKKLIEVQKIYLNSISVDPSMEDLFKMLYEYTKNVVNHFLTSEQQNENNKQQIQTLQNKITQLNTQNNNFHELIQTQKNKFKINKQKLDHIQKINRQQNQKILILQKQNNYFKQIKSEQVIKQEIITDINNYIIQFLSYVQNQINNKQFLNNHLSLSDTESKVNIDQKIQKSILKTIKKISQTGTNKLQQERKQNSKTIKSYENELQKMNALINQLQIQLKQKDQQYEQLLCTFTEYKGTTQTRRSLHKTPGKTRSNSSGKHEQMKSLKYSMQKFIEQQKKLLQKLNQVQNQKNHLHQRTKSLQNDLFQNQIEIEFLKQNINILEKKIQDDNFYFKKQLNIFKEKQVIYNKQFQLIKNNIEKQYLQKQKKLTQKFDSISQSRQLTIQDNHNNFIKIQNQLNNQIYHLKNQLKIKSTELVKIQQLENIKSQNSLLQTECNDLKNKMMQYQTKLALGTQVNIEFQNLIKQNIHLQEDISRISIKSKQYEQQLLNYKQKYQNEQKTSQQLEIIQLQQQLAKVKQNHNIIMNKQIERILKQQQQHFKIFLIKHDEQIQQHFLNQVIPQQLKQYQLDNNKIQDHQQITQKQSQLNKQNNSINTTIQNYLNQQIDNLKQNNLYLKEQYQLQYRASVQKQNQLEQQQRIIDSMKSKFDQQIHQYQNTIELLQNNNKKHLEIQQNIRNYLHVLQISYEQAITGVVSENIQKLYLQKKTQQTHQIIKQVFITDPSHETTINNLKVKLDEQVKAIKDLQTKIKTQQIEKMKLLQTIQVASDKKTIVQSLQYKMLQENMKRISLALDDLRKKYNEQQNANHELQLQLHSKKTAQDALKHQIRKVESTWQQKFYEQGRNYQKKILQINNERAIQSSQHKPLDEYKLLQTRYQQLKIRYTNQQLIKQQIQTKFTENIAELQNKINEIQNNSINEITKLNQEIINQKNNYYLLVNQINNKNKQINQINNHWIEERKQNQVALNQKLQETNTYYQNKINQLTSEIQNNKIIYETQRDSFNHRNCQQQLKAMEQKLTSQISLLKLQLDKITKIKNQQIQTFKLIINGQQNQIKSIQDNFQQYQTQCQSVKDKNNAQLDQLTNIVQEKDRQISKIQSQCQHQISIFLTQKQVIQNKLTQHIKNSSNNTEKQIQNTHLKVLELQSILKNKMIQISQLQLLNQKRKQDLEEQYNQFNVVQREREDFRIKCNRLENHVNRLESEINHLNNQLANCKKYILQCENRQQVLKSQIKTKTQNDCGSSFIQKVDVYKWKNKLIKQSSQPIKQRIKQVQSNKSDSFQKIQKMIDQLQNQRCNNQGHEYDEDEIQVLKKINEQVTQLVATNRQLQTKCALLQSQVDIGEKENDNTFFVVQFQDKMEALVNFLVDKQMLDNIEMYSKFIHSSKQYLNQHNIEEYFNSWINFMKALFMYINDNRTDELRQKAQELMDLKQQMNQILDKHIEFAEDQSYDTLAKYKMIFSDIKILLKEYMSSGNQEYIQMVWRSLEPETQ